MAHFVLQAWLLLVHQNLDAVRTGVTPITKLLRERNTSLTSHAARQQSQRKLLPPVNARCKRRTERVSFKICYDFLLVRILIWILNAFPIDHLHVIEQPIGFFFEAYIGADDIT